MIIADFSGARWRKSSHSGDATNCVEVAFSPASWRKSSHSSEATACVEVAFAPGTWRKSSHSGEATACVEVARTPGVVGVRDSKQDGSPILIFPASGWATFLRTR
jgi:hypothetical protein